VFDNRLIPVAKGDAVQAFAQVTNVAVTLKGGDLLVNQHCTGQDAPVSAVRVFVEVLLSQLEVAQNVGLESGVIDFHDDAFRVVQQRTAKPCKQGFTVGCQWCTAYKRSMPEAFKFPMNSIFEISSPNASWIACFSGLFASKL